MSMLRRNKDRVIIGLVLPLEFVSAKLKR